MCVQKVALKNSVQLHSREPLKNTQFVELIKNFKIILNTKLTKTTILSTLC